MMAQQTGSVQLNDTTVVDAKPLRTLTPMFPAPLGLHTFTPQNSPSFVCVTPFGPYVGGTESGMPAGVPPMFAAPAAPADPGQRQPTVNMNGTVHANGTATNSLATPSLQTPPSAATQESGKRKRGRSKRVPDTTVHSAPSVPLIPPNPPVPSLPLVPSVPSAPQEGNNVVLPTPSSATAQESGKRKRGRPKRLQDVPGQSTPSAPQADSTPVLQTLPAPTVHESGTRKRGRPKRVQDGSDTSTPPVHLKDSDLAFQFFYSNASPLVIHYHTHITAQKHLCHAPVDLSHEVQTYFSLLSKPSCNAAS